MKVKFINGNEITFDLEENTILEVKKKVADHKDSSPENVKLIYMGKVLNENDTFEMHKLTPDSVLTAVVKKNYYYYCSCFNSRYCIRSNSYWSSNWNCSSKYRTE